MTAGDSLVTYGPCGGGYGNPLEREPSKVLADVLDGFITAKMAKTDYGVVIRNKAVNQAATAQLRAAG